MVEASRVIPEPGQHSGAEDNAESGKTAIELGVRVSFKTLRELGFQLGQLSVEQP